MAILQSSRQHNGGCVSPLRSSVNNGYHSDPETDEDRLFYRQGSRDRRSVLGVLGSNRIEEDVISSFHKRSTDRYA